MDSSRKIRILFVTPLASRTGSEVMLWYILKHFDRSRYEVGVASYMPGELLQEVPEDVKVFRVPGTFGVRERISYHLGWDPIAGALKRIQKTFKADLWYLNTIVLPRAASVAVSLKVPFVVHFHEMPLSYIYINRKEFERIIHEASHLIGCSEATCRGIRQAGGKRVSLCHSFIDHELGKEDPSKTAAIRQRFGIAPGDFVWIMSGTTSERKGFDFFPEIAEALDEEKVHMVWVGGSVDDGYVSWVENRIGASASKTKIHLAGKQTEDYAQYLHVADGFVLTSRQDPFPLVMIEAAALGKPIVSFPSGGVSELLTENMGIVTEDISVKQLVSGMRRAMSGQWVHDPLAARRRAAGFDLAGGMREWHRTMNSVTDGL